MPARRNQVRYVSVVEPYARPSPKASEKKKAPTATVIAKNLTHKWEVIDQIAQEITALHSQLVHLGVPYDKRVFADINSDNFKALRERRDAANKRGDANLAAIINHGCPWQEGTLRGFDSPADGRVGGGKAEAVKCEAVKCELVKYEAVKYEPIKLEDVEDDVKRVGEDIDTSDK